MSKSKTIRRKVSSYNVECEIRHFLNKYGYKIVSIEESRHQPDPENLPDLVLYSYVVMVDRQFKLTRKVYTAYSRLDSRMFKKHNAHVFVGFDHIFDWC